MAQIKSLPTPGTFIECRFDDGWVPAPYQVGYSWVMLEIPDIQGKWTNSRDVALKLMQAGAQSDLLEELHIIGRPKTISDTWQHEIETPWSRTNIATKGTLLPDDVRRAAANVIVF